MELKPSKNKVVPFAGSCVVLSKRQESQRIADMDRLVRVAAQSKSCEHGPKREALVAEHSALLAMHLEKYRSYYNATIN